MQTNHTTHTRAIEEAYFHTGNSGITTRVIETIRQYETDAERNARHDYERDYSNGIMPSTELSMACSGERYFGHKLEFVHGAMGHSSTMSVPVLSPDMLDVMIEMLGRVKTRMLTTVGYKAPHEITESDRRRVVKMKYGLTLEEVWSPEIIVSQWSTASRFLGHNLMDCGVVVGFEPYNGKPIETGSSGEGGSPYYRYEDIGKPVSEAKQPDDFDPNTAVKRSKKELRQTFSVDVGDMDQQTTEAAIAKFIDEVKNQALGEVGKKLSAMDKQTKPRD